MRSLFLDDESALKLAEISGPTTKAVFGNKCDALVAYTGHTDAPSQRLLFFVLELAKGDEPQIIALQRLLVGIIVDTLGDGFRRVGSHVTYAGDRISFVDFGRGNGFVNTRLGFYLPHKDSGLGDSKLVLSALRPPSPINVWVPMVLERAVLEFDDMVLAACALRVTPTRMRE